jgi:hypothetical protein
MPCEFNSGQGKPRDYHVASFNGRRILPSFSCADTVADGISLGSVEVLGVLRATEDNGLLTDVALRARLGGPASEVIKLPLLQVRESNERGGWHRRASIGWGVYAFLGQNRSRCGRELRRERG